jgi:hypothetical protein
MTGLASSSSVKLAARSSVVAGLGVGIAPGVGEIDLRNPAQVALVDAVTAVIFLGQVREGARPRIGRVQIFVPGPGGGAQVLGRRHTRHVAHHLHAQHHRGPVSARLDVGGGGQHGQAARGAGRFVPRRRHAGEPRVGHGEEAAQHALAGEQLADEIADVADVDVLRVQIRFRQRAVNGLARSRRRSPVPHG